MLAAQRAAKKFKGNFVEKSPAEIASLQAIRQNNRPGQAVLTFLATCQAPTKSLPTLGLTDNGF
jgi:hypothetical protein